MLFDLNRSLYAQKEAIVVTHLRRMENFYPCQTDGECYQRLLCIENFGGA